MIQNRLTKQPSFILSAMCICFVCLVSGFLMRPTYQPLAAAPLAQACGGLEQEAESGLLIGDFTVVNDSEASGGAYVEVPEGTPVDDPTAHGLELCFRITQAGTYQMYGVVSANGILQDSFFVKVNGAPSGDGYLWDFPENGTFVRDLVNDRTNQDPVLLNLAPGEYTVRLQIRETRAKIDTFGFERVGNLTTTPTIAPLTPTNTPSPTSTSTSTPSPTATPLPAGCQLLENGDFEAGSDLSAWSTQRGANLTVVSDAYAGNWAGKVDNVNDSGWIYQREPIVVGATYELSGYYKTEGSGFFQFGMQWLDAANEQVGEEDLIVVPDPIAEYEPFAVSGTAPAGATQVEVWLYAGNGNVFLVDELIYKVADCDPSGIPTATPVPSATNTPAPPTATPVSPTSTSAPQTVTPMGPTETVPASTNTPVAPTNTPSPAVTQVPAAPIYLPMVYEKPDIFPTATPVPTATPAPITCLASDREPNNISAQVDDLPVCLNQDVPGTLSLDSDVRDFYYLELEQASSLIISIAGVQSGNQFILALYDGNGQPIISNGEETLDKTLVARDLAPGSYFVGVYIDRAVGVNQPYLLRVSD